MSGGVKNKRKTAGARLRPLLSAKKGKRGGTQNKLI